ncbi:LacI family transcriptional regulator, partial [Bifidobacterium animalis subsp. lactis]
SSIVLPHSSRACKRSALGVSNRFDIRRFTALCRNAVAGGRNLHIQSDSARQTGSIPRAIAHGAENEEANM